MHIVDLGGSRIHVLEIHPGLVGESERVTASIDDLDPAIVLVDLDTSTSLRAVEVAAGTVKRFDASTIDTLFEAESARRFNTENPRVPRRSPFVAAARAARAAKASFVAARPNHAPLGFFGRIRARRLMKTLTGTAPPAFARAFAASMTAEGLFDPIAQAREARARIEAALDEGRAPILLIIQAHRADAYRQMLAKLPRRSAA